ncbi:MAG TPA: collagen-like protein [Bdellovibrionales bacterium]|nr:collagen-like protein [Bdellovibrionales bacterium]
MIAQMLAMIALVAAFGSSIASFTSAQARSQRDLNTRANAILMRQAFVNILSNPIAWDKTRVRNQALMNCVALQKQLGMPCNSDPRIGRPQTERQRIVLVNSAGESVIKDGANDGFTIDGLPCDTFRPAPNGDPNCPIQFRAMWRASCTAGTCTSSMNAAEFISLEFSHSPGDGAIMNPANYRLNETNRMEFASSGSPALNCAERNMIYIGEGQIYNGQRADDQGCVGTHAFWGPRGETGDKGAKGSKGPKGTRGPEGPPGRCI